MKQHDNIYVRSINMKRATLKQRFFAFIIDYAIFFIIGFPIIIYTKPPIHDSEIIMPLVLLLNLLFLGKDTTGKSPGKILMKIQILKKKGGSNPGILLPFVRNLFLWLGFIEILFILFNKNHERIGDLATGTIVVKTKSF